MLFLGSSISPSKWPRHLSSSHFSFWAILIFTTALTLGRKVSHSFPPQVELSNPRMPTLQITSPDHQLVWGTGSGAWSEWCCPSVLTKNKETVDRLQYCPEHLLLLTSKPQKTIWRGHAPMDINNWKVSWSCRVYFRETRTIQWFSVHCCSEIPLPIAPWLLVEALLSTNLPCSIHFPT